MNGYNTAARRRSILIFCIGMGATAVVLILVVAIITAATKSTEIRDQQVDRESTVEQNDETLQIIKSCTTPGLPCYERSQRQLARAVGDINQVIVLAAACASGSFTRSETEIQACVLDRLGEGR